MFDQICYTQVLAEVVFDEEGTLMFVASQGRELYAVDNTGKMVQSSHAFSSLSLLFLGVYPRVMMMMVMMVNMMMMIV